MLNENLFGSDDQGQPHNGKKMINHLDQVSSRIILADQYVCLTNVYNHYTIHQYGLNWDHINQ